MGDAWGGSFGSNEGGSCSTGGVCGTGGWTGPKPGDPDNNAVLSAIPASGGVQLIWSYPSTNAHAVAHTILYRATVPTFSLAVEKGKVDGSTYFDRIPAEEIQEYFYWIKFVSIYGTIGLPIGPASAIPLSLIDGIITDLTGKIDAGILAQSLRERIDRIAFIDGALTGEALNRLADNAEFSNVIANLQGDAAEALLYIQNLSTANIAHALALTSESDARNLAIAVEAQSRIDAVLAEAEIRAASITAHVTDLLALIDNKHTTVTSLIQSEETSRISADGVLSQKVDIVAATMNMVRDSVASIVLSEVTARVSANEAIAQDITTLYTNFANNTALIQEEATARSTADVAEATLRTDLATQFRGAYTGTDINSVTTGLLYQERTARANADAGLSQQITLLSAGAGEQFDYKQIFYFDSSVDGWSGNGTPTVAAGWLRPANHATDPYVTSAAGLAIPASTYGQVRIRVRKYGAPVWGGLVWWKQVGDATWDVSRQIAVSAPTYDANGIGLLSVTTNWTGTIDSLRIDLSTGQTATDYFEIDWVAIGRPSPGASTASILDEQTARAAADLAEATSRQALSSKMTGLADPSTATLATLASGLLYEERQTRTTNDTALATSISSLQATVTTNNNTVTGAITTEATARATADTGLASQISSVSATTNANAAAILTEQTARADSDTSLAMQIQVVGAVTDSIRAATAAFLVSEVSTRTTETEAVVSSVNVLSAAVVTDRANTLSMISTESTTRATQDTALATQITTLGATVAGNIAAAVATETTARASADATLATQITTAQTAMGNNLASAQATLQTNINTVDGKATAIGARWTAVVDVNGLIGGFGVYNNGTTVEAGFDVDTFWVGRTTNKKKPFIISGSTVYIDSAMIANLSADKITSGFINSARIDAANLNVKGQVNVGDYTGYAFPPAGGTGVHISSYGMLMGNANASAGNPGGKYFQIYTPVGGAPSIYTNIPAYIEDLQVTNAKIGNLQVTGNKIGSASQGSIWIPAGGSVTFNSGFGRAPLVSTCSASLDTGGVAVDIGFYKDTYRFRAYTSGDGTFTIYNDSNRVSDVGNSALGGTVIYAYI